MLMYAKQAEAATMTCMTQSCCMQKLHIFLLHLAGVYTGACNAAFAVSLKAAVCEGCVHKQQHRLNLTTSHVRQQVLPKQQQLLSHLCTFRLAGRSLQKHWWLPHHLWMNAVAASQNASPKAWSGEPTARCYGWDRDFERAPGSTKLV